VKYEIGKVLYNVTNVGTVYNCKIIGYTDREYVLETMKSEGILKAFKWYCPYSCAEDSLFDDCSKGEEVALKRKCDREQKRIDFIVGKLR
jgi:hypothetical protein